MSIHVYIVKIPYLSCCIQYNLTIIKIIVIIIIIIAKTVVLVLVFYIFIFAIFLVLFVYSREECKPMHACFISLSKGEVTVKSEKFNLAF